MSISSKIKRYYRQSRSDLSREQHTPEKNSNSNSYNSTTSSISNSHNFSPVNLFLFPYAEHEETEPLAGPSMRPYLKAASRQLEAIQSKIKVPETEHSSPSDSDEIPPICQAAPHQSQAARERMIVGDNTQSKTSMRPDCISAKRKGKRRRTKETTDGFVYFLCFLAFLSFLIFLLFVIFLFCLYVHK